MSNNYDLSPIIDDQELEIFSQVETQVEKSLIAGDISMILKYGHGLRRNMQVQGVAMAKLLSMIEKNWGLYQQAGADGDFYDIIYAELGYAHDTVKKYVAVWRDVMENPTVPDDVKHKILKGMPIQTLLLLPAAVKEGTLDWKEVASAATHAEVADAVRKARGVQTSSGQRIVISLDFRTGLLSARQGSGNSIPIGKLNIPYENDVSEKAIERIIKQSGIVER